MASGRQRVTDQARPAPFAAGLPACINIRREAPHGQAGPDVAAAQHYSAEALDATLDEVAPGTGVRVIPGRGVIDRTRLRLAPAKSSPSPVWGGGVLSHPSPNFTNEERPTTARGNGYPPTTESRRAVTTTNDHELDDGRLPSVCPECGAVFTREDNRARCTDCLPVRHTSNPTREKRRGSARARGYDVAWDRLSLRARRLSPLCEDCGRPDDLTTDHSPVAWERRAAGLPIRLRDVSVVCRRCNSERGAARGPDAAQHDRWTRHRSQLDELVDELDDRDDDEPDRFT